MSDLEIGVCKLTHYLEDYDDFNHNLLFILLPRWLSHSGEMKENILTSWVFDAGINR